MEMSAPPNPPSAAKIALTGPISVLRPVAPPHPRLILAMHAVAIVFAVSVEDLLRPSRGPQHIAFARQVAMYVCHVVLRQSLVAVGRAFGRDRTTAAYACRKVEDARDDHRVDERVALIEDVLVKAKTPGRKSSPKRKG